MVTVLRRTIKMAPRSTEERSDTDDGADNQTGPTTPTCG